MLVGHFTGPFKWHGLVKPIKGKRPGPFTEPFLLSLRALSLFLILFVAFLWLQWRRGRRRRQRRQWGRWQEQRRHRPEENSMYKRSRRCSSNSIHGRRSWRDSKESSRRECGVTGTLEPGNHSLSALASALASAKRSFLLESKWYAGFCFLFLWICFGIQRS